MRVSGVLYLLSAALFGAVAADKAYEEYGTSKTAFYSCIVMIQSQASFCPPTNFYLTDYACFCHNPEAVATMSGCYHYFNRNTTTNVDYLSGLCMEYFNMTLTREQFENAYDNYTKYAMAPADIPNFNISVPIKVPLKLDDTLTRLYWDAEFKFLSNYDNSLYYGAGALAYWAIIFILAAMRHWGMILFPGVFKRMTGPLTTRFRKHVSLPAFLYRKKAEHQPLAKVFDALFPSRLESLVIFGWTVVVIAVSACNYLYTEGDPVLPGREYAMTRYVADRTGIVATLFIPLLYLLAGRNNFLHYLTGISFSTFLLYHRWIARVTMILVIIHSITFSINFGKFFALNMAETYVIWGTVGTIAGSLMLVQGMLVLRRNSYEIFLGVHIVFAALFLVGSWYHVLTLGYIWFFYPVVGVWALDRLIRLVRLFMFGFPKAEVTLLADETLRVVTPKPKYWQSTPGGYAFIHFMRPTCFWQSHPFTFTSSPDSDEIVMYLKVKGGVTHGLYQYLVSHPGKTALIRVGLEGPYGSSSLAYKADTAVYVAGGNGIPGIYSEVMDLAHRSRDNSRQSLKLVWIVRSWKSLLFFYQELLQLKDTKIISTVYITTPDLVAGLEDFNLRIPVIDDNTKLEDPAIEEIKKEEAQELKSLENDTDDKDLVTDKIVSSDNDSETSKTYSKIISQIKAELSHVEFREGRPVIDRIVELEIAESSGSTSFVACGHPRMVDDVRYAVVQNVDNKERKRVDFYEKLEVWA